MFESDDVDFEEIGFLTNKIQDNLYDLESVERLYEIYKKWDDRIFAEGDEELVTSLIIELGTDKLTDSPIEKLFDVIYGSDSCEFKWISLIEETLIRMELGFNCWSCESFIHFEHSSSHSVLYDDLGIEENPRSNEYKGKVVLMCDDCFEESFPENE